MLQLLQTHVIVQHMNVTPCLRLGSISTSSIPVHVSPLSLLPSWPQSPLSAAPPEILYTLHNQWHTQDFSLRVSVTDVGQRRSVRGSMLHIKNRHWRHAWLHLSPGRHVMSRDWSTNRLDPIFGHNWTFSGHIRWSANHVTSRRHHGRLTNCRSEETCRGCQRDRTC